jgi:hypothetical protein
MQHSKPINRAILLLLLCTATLVGAGSPAVAQHKKSGKKTKTAATGVPKNTPKQPLTMNDPHLLQEPTADHKIIVYQMMTRLFGNQNTTNKIYGSLEENGVGKMNDVSATALAELRKLGISHVWYTGLIEHATMTDFTPFGIPLDDADVVKGRAGSAYAIKDYYDISPELAVQVPNRMQEFAALVERNHQAGLKVLIDFVPNHTARQYQPGVGSVHPAATDVQALGFWQNNFYYYNDAPLKLAFATPTQTFVEVPAKATGNDAEKALVFAQTYGALRRRIESFVELPFGSLTRLGLQAKVDDIGAAHDTSAKG